jgi:hypothetical protein
VLRLHPFGVVARERVEQWLTLRAQDGLAPQELYHQAEEQLRDWQMISPGPSTLERLIGAIGVQTRQGLFEQLAMRLSLEMQGGFDALLQVRAGQTQSTFAALQQYPPEATPMPYALASSTSRPVGAMSPSRSWCTRTPAGRKSESTPMVRRPSLARQAATALPNNPIVTI